MPPALGERPFFVGCYPFRVTLVSNPVDTHVCFPEWLAARFGGDSLVTDTDPDDTEVAQAVAAAQGHSCIVLGSYNGCTRPGQQKLLHALAALGIPMVCVALRNPDDLAELPDHVYGLAVYEYTLSSLEIASEVLSGALKPAGPSARHAGGKSMSGYVCGWDGGGTKTEVLCLSLNGETLADAAFGP